MAARFDAEYAKAIIRIMESDGFDQTGSGPRSFESLDPADCIHVRLKLAKLNLK
jgi:hypothetical protein